jgi:hypothetical protein
MIGALLMLVAMQQMTPVPSDAQLQEVKELQFEMYQRCTSEAYLTCLKMSKNECEAATIAAAETADTEIDRATGSKAPTAFDASSHIGLAAGVFYTEMDKRTGDRFVKCVQKN